MKVKKSLIKLMDLFVRAAQRFKKNEVVFEDCRFLSVFYKNGNFRSHWSPICRKEREDRTIASNDMNVSASIDDLSTFHDGK